MKAGAGANVTDYIKRVAWTRVLNTNITILINANSLCVMRRQNDIGAVELIEDQISGCTGSIISNREKITPGWVPKCGTRRIDAKQNIVIVGNIVAVGYVVVS